MKRIILLLAMSVLSSAISFGQKKYEMVVKKTDGTESVFNTEDVARTYFREISDGVGQDGNHEYVDLGLPSGTKWASCNVGANKPEEYGGYYAWGETEEKENYDWSTYIHSEGSEETCHDLGSDISGTEYDVAHVKWGDNWCMPTLDDFIELLDNCTSEWTMLNGVNGRKFTSKINGNSIFLPAAGFRFGGDLRDAGSHCLSWSSTLALYDSGYANGLYFDSRNASRYSNLRYLGRPVRPVCRSSTNDIESEGYCLIGTWTGHMVYTYPDSYGNINQVQFDAEMIFKFNSNNKYTEGLGTEIDRAGDETQTLYFTWHIDINGNIYLRYNESGKIFMLDVSNSTKGFHLDQNNFYGYMVAQKNVEEIEFSFTRKDTPTKAKKLKANTSNIPFKIVKR